MSCGIGWGKRYEKDVIDFKQVTVAAVDDLGKYAASGKKGGVLFGLGIC